MPITDELRSLALERGSAADISALAISQGMHKLRDDGLAKIKEGLTTIPEVVCVTGST
jgi:type II secretory ATPase GspE/PulE/Tfp pilus assembly ATPase PilB-like protein